MTQFAKRSSDLRVAFKLLVAGALLGSLILASTLQVRSSMAEAASGSPLALQGLQKAPHEIINCSTEAHGAEYGFTDPQTGPAGVHLSEDEIISILNRTSGTSAFYSAYGLRLPSDTM